MGTCPECLALPLRVSDSFVADAQAYAQAVIYAVDNGASVVQEALGTVNHTSYMRRAHDYAYENNVTVIASAADENSRHQNYPGTGNHTVYVNSVRAAGNPQNATTFLAFNACTNFGGQVVVSVASKSCSSQAVGRSAGIAGLIYAASISDKRPGGPLNPPITAEETKQLFVASAMDVNFPESQPEHPAHNPDLYPSLPGWDQRFGYGRLNAYNAVKDVWEGNIPPEVDILSPEWFAPIEQARANKVILSGTIQANRAQNFDYVIEWAVGIEPSDADFQTLTSGSAQTAPVTGDLAELDINDLVVDNEGDISDRYVVTFRIRADADYGDKRVEGEARRVVHVYADPDLADGFPVRLGVDAGGSQQKGASGEGSPKLADIDGDGVKDIVYADADGVLSVIKGDGSAVSGFPLRLGSLRYLDDSFGDSTKDAPAFKNGDIIADDISNAILATPSIGDLDGDGDLEIVTADMRGWVYVVAHDGTAHPGFPTFLGEPVSGDFIRKGKTDPNTRIQAGVFASTALADFDGDNKLEIVLASMDGNLYVKRQDGSDQPGFPIEITAPVLWDGGDAFPSRIMTAPAVGDANADGLLDIVIGSNESGTSGNIGAFHLIHGDGALHAGGHEHTGWPIEVSSANTLPMVGEGTPSSPTMADVDGDGTLEIGLMGSAGKIFVMYADQSGSTPENPNFYAQADTNSWGEYSPLDDPANDKPFMNGFSSSAFIDLDGDKTLDFFTGGSGIGLLFNVLAATKNTPFTHQVAGWSLKDPEGLRKTVSALPGFPQTIEDIMFFFSPTSADVDGDGFPEVLAGSGGYYLHAWDACGREAEGFPKFTGGWILAAPAMGDVDNDGKLEVVITTRAGYLFVWNTEAPADGVVPWPEYRRDNANTGNTSLDLPQKATLAADKLIDCTEDKTFPNRNTHDPKEVTVRGGVCSVGGPWESKPTPLFLLGLLALTLGRRRR